VRERKRGRRGGERKGKEWKEIGEGKGAKV
jgi:hypothetical protein